MSFQGATFGYAYYNSQLINKLRSNWQRPLRPDGSSAPISTRVFFRIHQNGSVSNIRLDSPSASPELDRSALRAVQQASPFPPLPPQFTKDHLDLAITFTLEPSGL
ncbi:MAG: energy transducer TonB [Acidobacteriota bacterium]